MQNTSAARVAEVLTGERRDIFRPQPMARPVAGDIAAVTGMGPQAAADEKDLRSDETYIGYAQGRNSLLSAASGKMFPTSIGPPRRCRSTDGAWQVFGRSAASSPR